MLSYPYHLILGSQSPRRRELLGGLDIPFEVRPIPNIDESYPKTLPLEEVSEYIAREKADAYRASLAPNDLLITADTTVIVGNEILGKPRNRKVAEEMLHKLSGRTHTVVTGVALTLGQEHSESFSSQSLVTFAPLEESEIDYYLEHYAPYDKAGSYGVQEWIGYIAVQRIEGSFYNVMGLPAHPLYKALIALADEK